MSEKKNIASVLIDEQEESWIQRAVVANAPTIIGVFANLVVIFADYRAYDVIYQLTSSWWKALAASLACAIPFLLWEIGWQYNYTTEGWRRTSLGMAGLAFVTSIVLGVADYVGMTGVNAADWLLGSVVVLTGVHTVIGLLYYYNDPDVATRRFRKQALARADRRRINAQLTRQLLGEGREILKDTDQLGREFSPEDVKMIMDILEGKKSKRTTNIPVASYAQTVDRTNVRDDSAKSTASNAPKSENPPVDTPVWEMAAFLAKMGIPDIDTARARWRGEEYKHFAAEVSQKLDIRSQNMRSLWGELYPTQAAKQ